MPSAPSARSSSTSYFGAPSDGGGSVSPRIESLHAPSEDDGRVETGRPVAEVGPRGSGVTVAPPSDRRFAAVTVRRGYSPGSVMTAPSPLPASPPAALEVVRPGEVAYGTAL